MEKLIKISDLLANDGQIKGLPKNPRFIKDFRFEKLKKSIKDDPEMLSLRELLVYPFNGKYVVIGGNMRLRAASSLGYSEMPCKIIPIETSVEKLRAYVIKDNIAFGENDMDELANSWDDVELDDFGFELPVEKETSSDEKEEVEVPKEQPSVIVACANEFEQNEVFNKLSALGYNPTLSSISTKIKVGKSKKKK